MTAQQFFERYGVTLLVVGVLALVIAVLPGNAPERTLSDLGPSSPAGLSGPSGVTSSGPAGLGILDPAAPDGVGAPTIGGSQGGVVVGAGGSGGVSSAGVDCRSDGRQHGVSLYMPPCFGYDGDNGGATWRGVTADQIKVVRYMSQIDPATEAILEGARLADDESVRGRAYEALRVYGNQHYQTYGREVVLINYEASGPGDNDEAMRADAVKIANDVGAFAVIIGTPEAGVPPVLARELAERGVVCICTTSLSSQWYLETPPYIFGALPTSNEYAVQLAEFIGKRVARRNAVWAGDELNPSQTYQQQERKFGLIYIEGASGRVDPEGKRARDLMVAEFAKYGVTFAAEHAYLYDPGRNQADVSTMIASMRSAGVTTIVPLVDPLYPVLITQEATRQGYFPEWFISGTGLSDTTAAGRLYDQAQWQNAYGISPLWVTWETVSNGGSYREVYHGNPDIPEGQQGVLIEIYGAAVRGIFYGVHMAGPVLTPDTLSAGMFAYPPTGGKPAAPLVYWTREYPAAIKDFTEVWYDVDRSGPDERGDPGNGMIVKVDQGKRYRPGEWPSSDPKAFIEDGNDLAVSDDPPGGGDPDHEQDGHRHEGACWSCPGFTTTR